MVLSNSEYLTVSVTKISNDTTEKEIRDRLSGFGAILKVSLHLSTESHTSPESSKLLPFESWARVTFGAPFFAEAAVMAQNMFHPWILKGMKPAPQENIFTQVFKS